MPALFYLILILAALILVPCVGLVNRGHGVFSVRCALCSLYLLPECDGFPILPGNFSSSSCVFCCVVECLCLKS